MKIVRQTPTDIAVVCYQETPKSRKSEMSPTLEKAEKVVLQKLTQIVKDFYYKGYEVPEFTDIAFEIQTRSRGDYPYFFEPPLRQLYVLWDNPDYFNIIISVHYQQDDKPKKLRLEYVSLREVLHLKEFSGLDNFRKCGQALNALQDPQILSLLLRAVGR